jgi:hypothetical protein
MGFCRVYTRMLERTVFTTIEFTSGLLDSTLLAICKVYFRKILILVLKKSNQQRGDGDG